MAHAGNDVEGIQIVHLLHHLIGNLVEFQHHQPATRTQHTICFVQCLLRYGHVPDAKGNRVNVEGVVFKGQGHRVAHDPIQTIGHRRGLGPFAAFGQHRLCQVQNGGMAAARTLQKTEGNVTGPARNIQQLLARARRKPIHHRIFPDTVDAHAHGVVHHVVLVGDRVEDTLNLACLFRFLNFAESEMRRFSRVFGHGTCRFLGLPLLIERQSADTMRPATQGPRHHA